MANEQRVDLEVVAVSFVEAFGIAAIGLVDVTGVQSREMAEIVARILGDSDSALGCTSWITHHIDVGSARPIKLRYYPVSKKLEEEMHREVVEMLDSGGD